MLHGPVTPGSPRVTSSLTAPAPAGPRKAHARVIAPAADAMSEPRQIPCVRPDASRRAQVVRPSHSSHPDTWTNPVTRNPGFQAGPTEDGGDVLAVLPLTASVPGRLGATAAQE